MPAFFTGSFVVIVDSLVNPIIYRVRTSQFRVVFIEILLRKTNVQAEEFETRILGQKLIKKKQKTKNNIDKRNNADTTHRNNSNERGHGQ